MMKLSRYIAAALLVAPIGAMAADPVVQNSFFPYEKEVPSHPFVKPGVVINQSNVDQAKDVLDPALYQQIKDGWYEVPVGPTTSYKLHPTYIAATEKNYKQVQLGEKVGNLSNYVAGRAFPQEPDPNDPRAGEKLAWNFQYGINYGDSGTIAPFYWSYRNLADGKLERRVTFNFHFMNYKHRTAQEPIPEVTPNPSNLFRGIYVKAQEPQDVADTQLLLHRYIDDTKLDSAWLYLGFQRRVRKLSTGQTTDSFLGSDIMIEDFEGYNGRISDMNWKYVGTKYVLSPYYDHDKIDPSPEFTDPEGFKFVDATGKGKCYPKITWQLRKVYEVEATPVDPSHPVGYRTFYFDAQIFGATRTLIYDRNKKLWKAFLIAKTRPEVHRAVNKDAGVGIDGFFAIIDVQSGHCTTGQFKTHYDPALNPPSRFSVDAMRSVN